MSHYYALVIIPADGDVNELVTEAMRPYDENLEIEQYEEDSETYWRNPHGVWDWWQIGGRWSGALSGYEPDKDPALTESCWFCHATGKRDDEVGRSYRVQHPEYTCNGCNGSGRRTLWPTQWPRHAGDVVPALDLSARLADLPDEALPFSIITHGSEAVTHREEWDGENWVDRQDKDGMRRVLATILAARMKAGLVDRVAVVDYHC